VRIVPRRRGTATRAAREVALSRELAALRESESRFAEAQALAHLGSWQWEVSSDELRWSDELFRIYGLAPQSCAPNGKTIMKHQHPADRRLIPEARERAVVEGRPFSVLHRIVRPDGEVRTLHARVKPISDEAGKVVRVFGTTQDVTEERRAEEEHQQAEERFRVAFDDAPIGIALGRSDWRFTQVNQAFCGITGYEPEALVGKTFRDLSHPDDLEAGAGGTDELLRGERSSYRAERRFRHADGHWIHVRLSASFARDSRDRPFMFIAQIEDVTEQKRVETALSQSSERLQAILDNSPFAIHMKDVEGRYLLANKRAASLFESDEDSFIGKTDHELLPPEVAERLVAADRRVLQSGSALAEEAEMITPSGPRTVFTQKFPLCEDDGRTYAVCGISLDITERVRMEEENRRLQAELYEAKRLETVGRLAGGIAHDFNNTLAVIVNYAALARNEVEEASLLAEELDEIRHAAERAADLTHQLLVFSRREHVHPRVTDLNAVLRETEWLLHRAIGEDVELVTELEEPLWSIEADASQLERVLLNLAVNARDAMPHGGTFLIRTDNVTLGANGRRPAGTAPGRFVRIRVTDTGTGMSEEVAARALDPFFTTKPPGEGSGLGLATVHGVVRQASGAVELASRPGEGTTVTIYLPATELPAAPLEPLLQPRSVKGNGESILVVEDEASVQRMICRILSGAGYAVESAAAPSYALEACARHDKRVELLLTDVVMPSMSGGELAEHALRLDPRLKVLFISGYPDDSKVRQGGDTTFSFLQKPFTPAELLSCVASALSQGSPSAGAEARTSARGGPRGERPPRA
jgi:PAS domain S-box-containing protein